MTNLEIARLFRKMAAAYTILGENRFKIIAYDNAATAVEHATSELKDLWDDNKLDTVPGLGSSIISHLDEIFKTGQSKHIEATLKKVNPAIFPLLEVPGIGPKKAEKIVETLGFDNPETVFADVEKAAHAGKIAKIESFGEKSQSEILAGLDRHKKGSIKEKRMVLPLADAIAEDVIDYMKKTLGSVIVKIDKLGSLRRQVATIGDIDLAVATKDFDKVLDAFVAFPKKVEVIDRGPTGATLLLSSGRQADLRVSKPEGYGAMLQYFTGSKYHNIRLRDYALKKNLSLNEYGIKKLSTKNKDLVEFDSEEKFYGFVGLDYIPPELREDTGEIEAAKNHALPKLLELTDVKGDLQMHSNFDLETSHDSGVNSMEDLQQAAALLGYEYLGITNHNPSVSKHTSAEIITKLTAQKNHIAKLNQASKLPKIISLLEVDISPDGTLPVPDEGLNELDACLVSIHSNFNLSKEAMTNRILKGLSHPVVKILAHPTGRLLGEREGFEADWEKIFTFCKAHDKAVEINCYPNRLDLPDTLVRLAGKMGLKFSLGTDSHDAASLGNMRYGVSVARRGWLTKASVVNSLSYDKILSWFRLRT